tara:strand:+ start:102820 stop:103323 length:504 start_codon:yes stop_codon:yes gene_type:complete
LVTIAPHINKIKRTESMSKLKATTLVLFISLFGVSFGQTKDKITDADLNKFADAFQVIQIENQKAQQQMSTVITDNGMKIERFSTIQQAATNPDQEVDATAEELKKHRVIMAEITKMQPAIEAKMEKAVANTGITVEEYQTIGTALQDDETLQKRFQNIMMKNAKQK